MGKNLIIKGADFSENAIIPTITWFTDNVRSNIQYNSTITSTTAGFSTENIMTGLQGKTFNVLRFPVTVKAGVITLLVIDVSKGYKSPVVVDSLDVDIPRINTTTNVLLVRDVEVPENCFVFYISRGVMKFQPYSSSDGRGYAYYVYGDGGIIHAGDSGNKHIHGIDFGMLEY